MKEVIHFKSQEDRMAYLKGGFEEITPKKVTKTAKKEPVDEKKSQNKASKSTKSKKTTKKGAKKDEISAE